MNDDETSNRRHGVGHPHIIKEKDLQRLSRLVKKNRSQIVDQQIAQCNAGPSRDGSKHTI